MACNYGLRTKFLDSTNYLTKFHPSSHACANFLQSLQRHISPAAYARELSKPSTDSASLLDQIEKSFSFWVCGFLGVT